MNNDPEMLKSALTQAEIQYCTIPQVDDGFQESWKALRDFILNQFRVPEEMFVREGYE